MKPLFVLLIVFIISFLIVKYIKGHFEFALPGRIAMSVMLLFTAVGHFLYAKGMSMMVPTFIPYKTELVYITGFFEIIAAITLFIPSLRIVMGWMLIIFFILVLPSNIYAAINHINYQTGTFDGMGVSYLWFRIPLQMVFIIWTYYCSVKML